MQFADFIKLTDSFKLFLVEINVGDEIEDATWVQDVTYTNCWYTENYDVGVPNKVTEDGSEYTERFTLTELNSNASGFYYDFENQKLYLHTSGSDDPGSQTGDDYDYKIVAFSYRYICNSQFGDGNEVVFAREQEALTDGSFELWDSSTDLTNYTETTAGTSTVNRDSSVVYAGGYSVRIDIDGSGNNASILQNIILKPSGKCKITFRYRHDGAGITSVLRIKDSASNVYLDSSGDWQAGATNISLANSNAEWTEYELEFYAHDDYTNYTIEFEGTDANSSNWFDDASLTIYREDNYYIPFLYSGSLPSIQQAVDDYYNSSVRMEFGTIRFINDGWWYSQIQNYLWYKKDITIRYGAKGSDYEDFETIFTGKTRKPMVGDEFASIDVTDVKALIYKEIPATKYWISNYANLEAGAEGLPIPIAYGEIYGIIPICIDTTAYEYKIANHEIEDILDVYKDGTALTGGGVDYTVDLANGEFTLSSDPGDSLITCDIQGKKCDIEDGTYSDNVADILYDILVNYSDIDASQIDLESFLDLKGGRTQSHQLYINVGRSCVEYVRLLQQSSLFHVIPLTNGKIGAFRYVTGTSSSTPRFVDEDYNEFSIIYDTSNIHNKIKVRYNHNPGDESYAKTVRTDSDVEYKYDEVNTKTITTTLKDEADAENLGDFYLDLLNEPQRKVSVVLPTRIFNLRPAEKIIFNKTRYMKEGTVTVFDEEPYRILELNKSLADGKVKVIAIEDLQSAGEGFCEVCYTCQSCNVEQDGSCSSCYTCEKCDAGECDSCQSCYYCQKCDAGECSSCEVCDSCEECESGQCGTCETCDSCQTCNTCQDCDSGECATCQTCDSCEECDSCQLGCYTGQCTSCESCDSCEGCNTCQNCDSCQKCYSGECSSCESCDSCQTCNTCQNCDTGECSSCQSCDTCQDCYSNECTLCESCDSCQTCNTCQNCDTGECSSCQACNTCQTCDSCEKCNTGQCTSCQTCNTCQNCYTCEVCDIVQG